MDHVDFGGLPLSFVLRATVLRAFVERTLIARIAGFAAFRILSAMLEGSLVRILVDLRDAQLALRHDEEDLRFFAAHQRSNDALNDAVIAERSECRWNLHVSAGFYPAPPPKVLKKERPSAGERAASSHF